MTIETQLAAIRARADAATEGPWEDWGGVDANGVTCASGPITWDDHGGEVFKPADATFIAAARTWVPALLSVVEDVMSVHIEREWRPLDGMYLGGTSCDHCRRSWPCPTVQTITRSLDKILG